MKGVCWYGLKNVTDLWQPVDAGYAEQLKTCIKHAFYNWLDGKENADRWYGADKTFSASERRILITQWAGNAYQSMLNEKWDPYRYRLFQKTGCLLTADGSDDQLVQPEGRPNYEVPPPAVFDASDEIPITPANIDASEEADGVEIETFEEEEVNLMVCDTRDVTEENEIEDADGYIFSFGT